ncbi:hypothetical protein BH23PLA1_BH23PLA1_06700 [soil metagenome]
MSTDDIVFDEITYREPHRMRRPDRDRRFACLAYEVPGPDDLPIFLSLSTADKIERHALSDTSVELGGILLGKECVDDQTGLPFVWITEALEAKHYENTQASFTYTHESWQEITRERDQKYPDLDIVGWYHTHPDFGIFLSGHDVFIQQHFFSQLLQVAYVVDPIRQTRGFFQWRGPALDQVGGYFVAADRNDRMALARLVNDLENIPDTESGGGALSPRLEAELIAMIRSPHQVSSSADRGQTAAVFSLLGIVIGALGVALALWIATLTREVRQQTAELAGLREGLSQSEASRQDEVQQARIDAKERALDALLRSVEIGSPPGRFVEEYNRMSRERDEAVEKAAVLAEVGYRLIVKDEQIGRLEQMVNRQADRLASYEKDQEDLDRLKGLEKDYRAQRTQLNRLKKELEAFEDLEANPNKYAIAWYSAAVGWGLCVLLGLGMVAIVARGLPTSEESVAPPPGDPGDPGSREAEPPHKIT